MCISIAFINHSLKENLSFQDRREGEKLFEVLTMMSKIFVFIRKIFIDLILNVVDSETPWGSPRRKTY